MFGARNRGSLFFSLWRPFSRQSCYRVSCQCSGLAAEGLESPSGSCSGPSGELREPLGSLWARSGRPQVERKMLPRTTQGTLWTAVGVQGGPGVLPRRGSFRARGRGPCRDRGRGPSDAQGRGPFEDPGAQGPMRALIARNALYT